MAKRNIIEVVEKIQNSKFDVLKNSDSVLDLIWAYSQLFLYGEQPSFCEKCLKNYFREITIKGTEMAKNLDLAKNRTLKPNWNGLKYIHKAGRHFDSYYINDDEAINLLNNNLLSENDFINLPNGYVSKNIPENLTWVNPEIIEENKIQEVLPEIKKNTTLAKTKKPKK